MLLLALLAAVTESVPSSSQFGVKEWGVLGVLGAQSIAMLILLQKGRGAIAKEVALVLQSNAQPANMKVQDPLNVRAHIDYTPQSKHDELSGRVESLREEVASRTDELRAEMNSRFIENARASAESRGKIYDLLREQGNANAAVATETKLTSARVAQIDTKIDALLIRMGAKVTSQ